MKGEWCYFRQWFSPEDCNRIVNLGLQLPAQPGKIGVNGTEIVDPYRRSQIRFINKELKEFSFLFDTIWRLALEANDEWFNFHLSRLNFLQLSEYHHSDNGEYQKHHDIFWINDDQKYHRKLTCVIQLTDHNNYQGGDFKTYDLVSPLDPQLVKEQGTVLFIPSFTLHSVTPVTQGIRHSIVAWIDGPKWR